MQKITNTQKLKSTKTQKYENSKTLILPTPGHQVNLKSNIEGERNMK